jgi:hypothetical protein
MSSRELDPIDNNDGLRTFYEGPDDGDDLDSLAPSPTTRRRSNGPRTGGNRGLAVSTDVIPLQCRGMSESWPTGFAD